MDTTLLYTKGLKKYFCHHGKYVKALDGLDISLETGVTTALVGESGCGKTTLAKTILQFYKPQSGRIYFQGKDITLKKHERFVRRNIQIVFQNPYLSLDPRCTIFNTLCEAFYVFNRVNKKEARHVLRDLLCAVELDESVLNCYPHQLSGGQRQRVCIARSLINKPPLVILDEPTSNLDVTTASTILDLLLKLQKEYKISFFFISHDLILLKKNSQFFYVMYQGKIVEYGPTTDVFNNTAHPYTKLLKQAAYHELHYCTEHEPAVAGCPFFWRCLYKTSDCNKRCVKSEVEPGHFVFCNLFAR